MKRPISFLISLIVLITPIVVNRGYAQTITSFSPSSGPIGTTVTITGTNFSPTAADNIVFFGATRGEVTSASDTQLSVTVPAGATYQPISVLVNGLTAYSVAPFVVTFPYGTDIDASSFAKVDLDFNPIPNSSNAIADLDGDGKSDLVVINAFTAAGISIIRNISTTEEITQDAFAGKVDLGTGYSSDVAIGDLDGDGKPDIIVTNNNGVSILKNTSTAGEITGSSFSNKVDFATGNYRIVIADLDNDGKPEIVTFDDHTVWILKNTSAIGEIGPSSFATRVSFSTGDYRNSDLAIADLDADGKPDIAVISWKGPGGIPPTYVGKLTLFRNTGMSGSITSGSFANRVDFPAVQFSTRIRVGDLDGDGKPDLATINATYFGSTVEIYKNTGAGPINTSSFSIGASLQTDYNVEFSATRQDIAIGDLDGDGRPDLAATFTYPFEVLVFRNMSTPGTLSFANKVSFAATDPYNVAMADLDGDGAPELIAGKSVLQNVNHRLRISSFSPTFGPIGTPVVITGNRFDSTAANNTVAFNGTISPVITSTSTSMTTSVPAGATTGTITVKAGGKTATSLVNFLVTNIKSFFPAYGPIGSTVIIYGIDFDPIPANNLVTFNGINAVVTGGSGIAITTTVPPNATTGIITVTAGGLTSQSPTYFTVSQQILSLNPGFGTIGTTVEIIGTNFDAIPSRNVVGFNGAYASTIRNTATAITTEVPPSATTGLVTVTINGITSYSPLVFTVTPVTAISKTVSEGYVYPIPARDQLVVQGFSSNLTSVSVFSILGKESHPLVEFSGDSAVIDIHELTFGLYILKASDGTKDISIKFIKE